VTAGEIQPIAKRSREGDAMTGIERPTWNMKHLGFTMGKISIAVDRSSRASSQSAAPSRSFQPEHWRARICSGVLALLMSSTGCTQRPRQIVLITIDTLRGDHVGPRPGAASLTPNLDRLAADGIRYSDALANCTMTLQSHMAMLTGLYPPRHHSDQEIYTAPRLLRARGYRTGAVVSSVVLRAKNTGLADDFDLYDESFDQVERNRPNVLIKSPSLQQRR
jgi:hypothetical protein